MNASRTLVSAHISLTKLKKKCVWWGGLACYLPWTGHHPVNLTCAQTEPKQTHGEHATPTQKGRDRCWI